jgi:hypothetical protein
MYKEASTSGSAPDSSEVYWQYVGGVLGENGSGWAYLPKEPSSTEDWLAVSSNFITNPEGSITGWGFTDGSVTDNSFNISADKFSLVTSTDYYPDWVYPLFEVQGAVLGTRPSYIVRSKAFFYPSGTSADNSSITRTVIDGENIETNRITVNKISSDNITDIKREGGILSLVNTSGTTETIDTDYIDINRGAGFNANEFEIGVYGTLLMDEDKFTNRNITTFFYDAGKVLISTGSANGGTQLQPETVTGGGLPNYIRINGNSFTRLSATPKYLKIRFTLTHKEDISTYINYGSISWNTIIKARQNYNIEW